MAWSAVNFRVGSASRVNTVVGTRGWASRRFATCVCLAGFWPRLRRRTWIPPVSAPLEEPMKLVRLEQDLHDVNGACVVHGRFSVLENGAPLTTLVNNRERSRVFWSCSIRFVLCGVSPCACGAFRCSFHVSGMCGDTRKWIRMDNYEKPEMLRVPLDALCLRISLMNLGHPAKFLDKALTPPEESAVRSSLQQLVDLSAMEFPRQLDEDGEMTESGWRKEDQKRLLKAGFCGAVTSVVRVCAEKHVCVVSISCASVCCFHSLGIFAGVSRVLCQSDGASVKAGFSGNRQE